MPLYRARPGDGVAWVTGASTGIGRSLAERLADQGYTVAATARRDELLAELVGERSGGRIVAFPCDVTDAAAMRATADAIEAEVGPIALAVFNAGAFFPARGERLDVEHFVRSYEINVFGVINGLVPAVEHMRERGRGHVAIIGSASAYVGLPLAGAYGSTKAALNGIAAALKFDFDKMNIRVQVINPGFVDTPLTKKNTFWMPALLGVDEAARRIVAGLEKGGFRVDFPRRLSWPLRLAGLLPSALYFPLMARATGWRKRPLRS